MRLYSNSIFCFTSQCWKARLWQIFCSWYIVSMASKLKPSKEVGNFLLVTSSSSRFSPISSAWLFRLFTKLQTLSRVIFQEGTIALVIWNIEEKKKQLLEITCITWMHFWSVNSLHFWVSLYSRLINTMLLIQ